MDFTVYTFGDVEVFRAAFTGVAMIFNADGFFVSNEGVGLGALAGVGLLFGLVLMLMQGVMHQKVEVGTFMMTIVVFVVLFVPKFSVNIEDYNGSAIAKVDNVPLGVALPAAMVSGIANELNIKMGTSFSTTEGYPSGLMTPQALTSPLKLLLSLRNGAAQLSTNEPRLASNLTNLIAYCSAGRPDAMNTWLSQKLAGDPVNFLVNKIATDKNTSGLTMFVQKGDTEAGLIACVDAANEILYEINDYYAGGADANSKLSNLLTAAAAKTGAASVSISGGKASVNAVTTEDMDNAMTTLAQSSAGAAMKFVKYSVLGPYVNAAFNCASDSGNPEDWAKCMPYNTSVMQWQEDAAAGGSFFQRLMFRGMNSLFFVWICLSPVVATVMLIMGYRGIKLAGSYLLFGGWAVSWYVGASIINFYMLKQVQYEVAMLGGVEALTQETMANFFFVLSDKIAVAGDMMASVPLIMMTVMSGSIYGLVSMSQKTGADRYDEKVNTPTPLASAPLMQPNVTASGAHGGAFVNRAIGGGGSFDMSWGASLADSNSVQSSQTLSKQIVSGIANSVKESWTGSAASERMQTLGRNLSAQGYEGVAFSTDDGKTFVVSKNNGWRQVDSNYTSGEASRTTSVGIGTGAVGKILPVSADYKMTDSKRAGENSSTNKESGNGAAGQTTRGASQKQEGGARLASDLSAGDVSRIAQTFRHDAGEDFQKTFSKNESEVQSFVESGGVTNTTTTSFGGKMSWSSEEVANRINNFKLGDMLNANTEGSKDNWSPLARQTYEDSKKLAMNEFAGNSGREQLAQLRALERAALVGDAGAREAYASMVRSFGGAEVGNIKPVSAMTSDSNRGTGADVATRVQGDTQNLQAPNSSAEQVAGNRNPGAAAAGAPGAVRQSFKNQVASVDQRSAEQQAALEKLQNATNTNPGGTRRPLVPPK